MLMTRHYPDLGSAYRFVEANSHLAEPIRSTTRDTSSVWNFCAHMLDVISWGNQWRNVGCFLRLVKKRWACLKPLVRYCSRECLLHFWSLFHHPKTLWCLRFPWITYLFGCVVIHQINLLSNATYTDDFWFQMWFIQTNWFSHVNIHIRFLNGKVSSPGN